MAKFCGNCGTQLDDNAIVCSNCGVNLESDSYAPKTKRKKSKRFKVILACVIAVVVGVLGCIGYCVADYFLDMNAINKEVSKYIDGYYLCDIDFDDVVDMVPEPLVDSFEGYFSEENFENTLNKRSLSFDEQYGDDISVSYEIEDFSRVSSDMQEMLIMSNGVLFNMVYNEEDDEEIDEMYSFVVEIEIDGDDGESTSYSNLFAVKCDDKWYLFQNSGYYGIQLTPVAYGICDR